jgi:hypothetical protein
VCVGVARRVILRIGSGPSVPQRSALLSESSDILGKKQIGQLGGAETSSFAESNGILCSPRHTRAKRGCKQGKQGNTHNQLHLLSSHTVNYSLQCWLQAAHLLATVRCTHIALLVPIKIASGCVRRCSTSRHPLYRKRSQRALAFCALIEIRRYFWENNKPANWARPRRARSRNRMESFAHLHIRALRELVGKGDKAIQVFKAVTC